MTSVEPVCGFCKGQPVGNAREWTSGKQLPACECPRCGVRTPFDWEEQDELYEQLANPAEHAELEVVSSETVVHPFTGEALDVCNAPDDHLARFLDDVREYESLLREAKAIVSREAIRRMDLDGRWTMRTDDYVLSAPSPQPSEAWEAEALYHDLKNLAAEGTISEEAVDRAVKVKTTYNVQTGGVKALRKLGGLIQKTVDRHATPFEKTRYVKVERAR